MSREKEYRAPELRMIPLDQIDVLNSRERNKQVFAEIVENIQNIGLKKPIVVTPRSKQSAGRYLLICGEGRLNAFKALGQHEIPAMVVDVDDESAYIMSLAENIARRKFNPLELMVGIDHLREKGYDKRVIAQKTGLSLDYVKGILHLLKNGEERLLMAVGSERIPLNAAIAIAGAGNDDKAIQAALQDAYESGKLRGGQLIQARRIIERRRLNGRSFGGRKTAPRPAAGITTSSLVRNYQREVERQKLLIKKAETAQRNLIFIVGALRQLLSDENFINLLRAEELDTMPQYLADRVWARGSGL